MFDYSEKPNGRVTFRLVTSTKTTQSPKETLLMSSEYIHYKINPISQENFQKTLSTENSL